MPVYRGHLPQELKQVAAQTSQTNKPRDIVKRLVANGKLQTVEKMQIVT